ncbi:hypothetical protein I4F81_007401 [Pyropia yezoensis]|uniref:Uncharacterized protein n=1 Tax=Pyropia yezoensis TaxID=2788 RepID=A0ACC3C4I8_PYRYE|nr:hypothetical protein I4F81_007401 [Neopyropia yezoensis]
MLEVPVDSTYETLHAFLAGDGVAAPAFAAEAAASLYLADGANALLAGPFTVPRGARRLAGGQIHLASFTVLPSGAVVAHVPEPPPAGELLAALRCRLAGVSKRQVLAAMAFPDLLPFFLLTRNELATALGVCVTLIKKIFRAHGIRHWPNRKLRNLKRRMDDRRRRLAAALAPPAARRRPSLAVARLHADLVGLEAEFRAVVEEATAGQASFLI